MAREMRPYPSPEVRSGGVQERRRPPRVFVGPCPLDTFSLEELVEWIEQASRSRERCLVSGVNASMYVLLKDKDAYRRDIQAMDVVVSDSFWLALSARLLGFKGVRHLAIVNVTFKVLEALARRRGKVFLLGARDATVERAAAEIEARYPGVRVVGFHHGYFSRGDEAEVARRLRDSGADVLLVGISTPKREAWMVDWGASIGVPVALGVGGLIDILGGATKEGPACLRKFGMMWFYRLLQEPARLWRRYLVGNTRFSWMMLKLWLSGNPQRSVRVNEVSKRT